MPSAPMDAPAPAAPAPTDDMSGQAPDMGNEIPPMDDSMSEPPMDAPEGMENTEGGDDKKKEIQKLAGELSELLHTYNEENGDDEELNKYVKGMIEAQTDGKNEDENDEPEMDGEMPEDEMGEPQPEEGMEEPQPEGEMPKMEGRKLTKKQLREEFAELNQKEKDIRVNQKIAKNNVKANNPFTPPKFN